MAKRIVLDQCWGAIIDVQDFFITQAGRHEAPRIKTNTRNFARLLSYFRIPLVVTLERPLALKGLLPREIERQTKGYAQVFEKDFFDLTKERKIRDHVKRLTRKQVIIAGCETDVCILQSCLGLLNLGYEVYVVDDLLFSSKPNVGAALERMKAEGAVFLTYKSLYYELVPCVEDNDLSEKRLKAFGPFPDDLPDCAV